MNDTLTDQSASPPPPLAPAPRPPLRRRTDDRMIAGVASGVARTLGIEASVARILFVVALFAGGLGLALYIAGWLLLPEDGSDEPIVTGAVTSRGAQFWVGVILLVIGVLALADQASSVTGDLAWPLVLIGIGVVLWRSSRETDGEPPTSPPPGAGPDGATAATGPPADSAGADPTTPTASAVGAGPDGPPPAPPAVTTSQTMPGEPVTRRRSILGRLTIATVLIVVGALWLGDQAGWFDLTFRDASAAALGIIGLGLVVGSWVGRARWLIFPGLLLIPIVALATTLHGSGVPFGAGMGERFYAPAMVSELDDPYQLTAGELRLDLTELAIEDERVEIDARVGAGQLTVLVPDDVALEIDAHVGVGEIDILGEGPNGADLEHSFNRTGDRGPVVLHLNASFGEIVVESVPAPATTSQEDQ